MSYAQFSIWRLGRLGRLRLRPLLHRACDQPTYRAGRFAPANKYEVLISGAHFFVSFGLLLFYSIFLFVLKAGAEIFFSFVLFVLFTFFASFCAF